MPQPRKRRRDFPFYKVQAFDTKLGTWKDEHKTFDTVEVAKDYIERKIAPRNARVTVIERNGRKVLT
jgi:hypothetical protein